MKFRQVLLIVMFSISSHAQENNDQDYFQLPLESLEDVNVSSVDFSNRTLTESFASAYVVTDKMIENMPMFTLGDYFEMLVPGVVVFPQGTNGAGVSSRGGVVTRRVKKHWDGHSINRLIADGSSLYYSPLLNDLQQIELVLGPGSVKHGTGAIGGYLNFIPKNGSDYQGTDVELDYGEVDDSVRLQAQYGTKYGINRDLYLYAGYYQADGFDLSNDFGGATSTSDNERAKFENRDKTILGNYEPSYKFSLNWTHDRFNLKTYFEHIEFNPGGLVADNEALNSWTQLSVQPRFTFQLPYNSSFELSSAVQLNDKSRVRTSIFDSSDTEKEGGRESVIELRGTYQTRYFDRHNLAVGGQFKWLSMDSRRHFFSSDPSLNRSFIDGEWQEYSLYIEDNISLSHKATLIAGLRYDAAKFTDDIKFDGRNLPQQTFLPSDISNVSPRLAFTYKTANDYVFRAVYQEGFSYPTMLDHQRWFTVNDFLDERNLPRLPDLDPQVLEDFELGVRGDLIKNKLSFDLTAYYYQLKNSSVFVNLRSNPATFLSPEDIAALPPGITGISLELEDDIDLYGGELSLGWKLSENINSNFSYAYTVPDHISARDNELGGLTTPGLSEWLEFPKHQFKANVNFKHKKWLFSVAGVYQSGLEIDDRFALGRENAADEYVRVNAGIQYKINEHASVSFIAKNVFGNNTPRINADPNRPWQGALGSDERLFYLGLKYDF